ncbi:MAG: hypothetical protein AAGA34_13245 [Pseudomonadota bacterium]
MIYRLPKAALLLALPLLAAPAFAQPETEDKTEDSEKVEKVEEAAEEKRICKRIAADMSSRRRTKVCLTRDEWKTFNKDQRRN